MSRETYTAYPLPSPVELGFLPKFQAWRPEQVEAIDRVINNKKRFTALAMPTGSGKSLTGMATALLHPGVKRALYLTSTTGLEDQAVEDFTVNGLVDIRGQRHYPCTATQPGHQLDRYRRGRWTLHCDEGPCHSGVPCSLAAVRGDPSRPGCDYYGKAWDARRAELVSTNYAKWLTAAENSEGFGEFDLIILDEGHDADKEVENFLTVEITKDDSKYLGSKYLQSTEIDEWKTWAGYHKPLLAIKIEQRQEIPVRDHEGAAELRRMKLLLGKLDRIRGMEPIEWILDNDGLRAKFAPMRVSRYTEKYLFRGIKHVLLMSATMTKKTTQLLGIDPDQLHFWEAPSRFPVERRPIYSINTVPAVRVDFKMHETTKYMLLRRLDMFLKPRIEQHHRKGIIHSVSYQRMKEIMAGSDYHDLMIVHDSADTKEKIRAFKEQEGPCILVSPSIVTGYDFPDDQCRFQVIVKVPQMHMGDPIAQARKEIDKEWSGYVAMQKLVQACGRGMRRPTDWCETAILDDHFADWFLNRYKKHAPRSFMDAIEYWEQFPPAMIVDAQGQVIRG